ncbi:MAG: hypothetical protein RL398_1520 [Planctomycetota bacterium]|jgi:CBS domain-containing protein
MIVKDWMSRNVRVVRTTDRAETAARALWEQDCGLVPVLDAGVRLVGVVTDRDLCMAAFLQGRPLAEIEVASAMSRRITTIRPGAGLADALAAMQQVAVHRLPVVDGDGKLVGIITTNDLLRAAAAGLLDGAHVLRTLAAIGRPRSTGAAAADCDVAAVDVHTEDAAAAAAATLREVDAATPAPAPAVPAALPAAKAKRSAKKSAKPTAKPSAARVAAKGRAGAPSRSTGTAKRRTKKA